MRHPLRVTLALVLAGCGARATPPPAASAPVGALAPAPLPIAGDEPGAEEGARREEPDEDPWLLARGRIVAGDGVILPPDAVVFVSARAVGPDGGAGGLVAAARLDRLPADFVLDGDDMLIPQLPLPRTIVLRAFSDQDDDVLTSQPGDMLGTREVEVPAEGVVLVIDRPR